MRQNHDPLLEAAAVIADGGAPDWASLEGLSDARQQAAGTALRTISAIAQLHETLTNAGAGSDRVDATPFEPGAPWAGLRIIERVGAGRFGDVYCAFDPSLDREVALKVLRTADDLTEVEDFVIDEGRLAARVQHPNVVTIYGAQRVDGRTGVWMEFVRGRTLEAELAEHGPFTSTALTRVAVELSGALAAVHAAGLVHRDVKTTNVMRDADGRVVLGDFGTGRDLDEPEERRAGLSGTPPYLAPEIFDGLPASPQSDLYSLGVLLFRLATGEFPVTGRSLDEYRAAHVAGGSRALTALRPDLPKRLTSAVDRALARRPEDRFPAASSFEHAVRAPQSRTGPVAIALGLGAVVAAVFLVMAWREPAPTPFPSGIQVEHIDHEFQRTYALRGPSIDDRQVPCGPRGVQSVALCDLVAGTINEFRRPEPRNAFGTNAIWPSPDGSQLAYVWVGTTVALMDVTGENARDLYTGADVNIIKWTDAGTALLADMRVPESDDRRVVRLQVTTGVETELWRYNRLTNLRPDVSPDGRTIVASRHVSPDERELVGIDVSSGTDLWTYPFAGRDAWPRWTPDGQAIVFVNHSGTPSLRMLWLNNRVPAGSPTVIRDMGRVAAVQLVGFSTDWTLFMRVTPPLRTSRIATWNLDPVDVMPSTRPLDTVSPLDTMGADWSPDGSQVAFLQGPFGSQTTLGTVVVADAAGGGRQPISLPGFIFRYGPTVRWSPAGRQLAVIYGETSGLGESLAVVDPTTRHVDPIVRAGQGETIRSPAWGPDGRQIYFIYTWRDSEQNRWNRSLRRVSVADRTIEDLLPLRGQGEGAIPLDVARDGSIALGLHRSSPQMPRQCVVRIMTRAGASEDRHTFSGDCTALTWSRDGARMAVATQTGLGNARAWSLWILDRAGGDPVRVPIEDVSRVWDLSFHPDGQALLYSDGDAPFDLWSVKGIQAIRRAGS